MGNCIACDVVVRRSLMVSLEDRKFIDSMLHGLAFKIYSIGDVEKLEGQANKDLVREYEMYLGERAQEIFGQYRDANDFERVLLGLQASAALRKYHEELKDGEKEEE